MTSRYHVQLEPIFSGQTSPDVFAFLFRIHRVDEDRVAEFELLAGKRFSHQVGGEATEETLTI